MASKSTKVCWDEARRLYVEEGLTVRAVAGRVGVTATPVQKRSKAEGWPGLRKEYRACVAREAVRKAGRYQGSKLGSLLAGVIEVRNAVQDRILNLLDENDLDPNVGDYARLTQVAVGIMEAQDQLRFVADVVRKTLEHHGVPEADIDDAVVDLLEQAGSAA